MQRGLGYDEAMHAGFPAQRMALALRAGQPAEAADALLDCDRYPFVSPVVLAAVQLVTGPSEWAMRRTGRALWALTCFGMFLLAGETVRRRAPRQGVAVAPWVALLLTASSPQASWVRWPERSSTTGWRSSRCWGSTWRSKRCGPATAGSCCRCSRAHCTWR